jgi:hypothetical protein
MSYDSTKFLVPLQDMLDYLNLDSPTQEQQDQIGFFLNMLSEFADTYIDRELLAKDHTEYHDGTGTPELMLDHYPVNSTSATISAFIDWDFEFTSDDKIDADDLFVDDERGILLYQNRVWPRGYRNVKVIYNAGYNSVPYDLQLSIQEAVAYFWERRQQKMWAKESISKGETSVTRVVSSLPQPVREVWDRYRRWR